MLSNTRGEQTVPEGRGEKKTGAVFRRRDAQKHSGDFFCRISDKASCQNFMRCVSIHVRPMSLSE
jgi:hypothetical protein